MAELEQRARELETELNDAQAAQEKSRLAKPLDGADLTGWLVNADELDRVEFAINTAKTELDSARSELIATLSAVGGDLVDNRGV